ncbi:MAG: 3-isopropylmalate dehydratase small subunit [Gammaproteobacteria bacterium]|nr:3-isopropylmalate dehydratase small subunit [Gammaproteobacteria bacterium]MBT8111565.1 3-isopropylmalate dehydratase small subunit [Gammaproteobacteria bacterium]NND47386.1 3-isopropylmalate dehydratase small subunit [Woeseiaceae bacterium]NNL46263.1 3-isopropylmalate dehydratase small subunit [Woeseiaceae bacterium]
MKAVTHIKSRTVVLPTRDIDTDQIIPARFLTTTSRDGLGQSAFYDLRYNRDGSEKTGFPLNQPAARGCEILVAGNNFGCGSSREHAPWALLDYGFKAIVSTEIADIFRNNSLKNGLVPVVVDENIHEWLKENPGARLEIDVANATLTMPDGRSIDFAIDGFAKHCLVEGIDQLGFLQQHLERIANFEETRAWKP